MFQLLCVMGDWERALTQLEVVGDLDAGALAMVQAYREGINCEVLRAAIFSGQHTPLLFGEPEQWMALLTQALQLTGQDKIAEAVELHDQAFEQAPVTSGTIDGEPFEWIADSDWRLGPVLEGIVNGRYYWIPLHRIRRIVVEPPADLRDVVWTPVHFTWANGGETVGFIPTRYAGSESSDDNLIRLARKTDWIQRTENVCFCVGQRTLVTDGGEFPLMDVREIVLDVDDDSSAENQLTSDSGDG